MKFYASLYCTLAFVCLGANGGRFSISRVPHKGEHTACNASMEFSNHMQAAGCMPRKSLVKLISEPSYEFLPNVVSVNRCEGFCMGPLACLPLKTIIRPIQVRRSHVVTREYSCYKVYVEEHTKCICECDVMPEDCNQYQIYDEDECSCQCMNMEEQRECEQMKGMVWDSDTCKCTCIMQEGQCSTGLTWIPSMCRCGKVIMVD